MSSPSWVNRCGRSRWPTEVPTSCASDADNHCALGQDALEVNDIALTSTETRVNAPMPLAKERWTTPLWRLIDSRGAPVLLFEVERAAWVGEFAQNLNDAFRGEGRRLVSFVRRWGLGEPLLPLRTAPSQLCEPLIFGAEVSPYRRNKPARDL